MKTTHTLILALLIAAGSLTAQDPAAPAPAPTPAAPDAQPAQPQSEMQKWIATTDEQWQMAFKRDVTDAHLTELEKLKQQYVAALEAAVTKASAAGDLDGVVALRNEEKRFAGTNLLQEQDEATDAATVKQIRAAVRAQIAKVEKDTVARTKALHAKYDQVLAQAQTQLTQRQRIEDALLIKAKREEVAKAWLADVNKTPVSTNFPQTPTASVASVAPTKTKQVVEIPSQPTSLSSELRNTKWRLGGGKTFTLHSDGTSTSSWNRRKGWWKISGPNSVELSITNAKSSRKATVNAERTLITLPHDKGEAPETATLIKQ